ncbi:uncharacterized protein A4U43_C06F15410 [Asparagus officinalis]|uniref:Uncharacterized protein n=1 Tax=Asparagus officinalis TaxID=4686 RepID=A0A5P1EMC8_ASPOF|nr:uncharacterized protein A4U43_C06F15410 [Asparagus officinalis]
MAPMPKKPRKYRVTEMSLPSRKAVAKVYDGLASPKTMRRQHCDVFLSKRGSSTRNQGRGNPWEVLQMSWTGYGSRGSAKAFILSIEHKKKPSRSSTGNEALYRAQQSAPPHAAGPRKPIPSRPDAMGEDLAHVPTGMSINVQNAH